MDPGIEEILADSRSAATRRAYECDWSDFVDWCTRAGCVCIPAEPEVVARYLAASSGRLKPATLARRLSALKLRHRQIGLPFEATHPLIRDVLAGIRRRRGIAPAQKLALTPEEVRLIAQILPDGLAGRRDRAVILLGFAGAFRRSELAALRRGDLTFTGEGLVVRLRRGKEDQEGRGSLKGVPFGSSPATCPVRAVKDWLVAARLGEGPLFRAIDRHGNVGGQALSGGAIANVVKRAVGAALRTQGWSEAEVRARMAAVSGHSLRAGFVTAAAAGGAAEWEIMGQTGHKRSDTVRRYVRLESLFAGNITRRIGL